MNLSMKCHSICFRYTSSIKYSQHAEQTAITLYQQKHCITKWKLSIMQQFYSCFWTNVKLKHYEVFFLRVMLWRMWTVFTCALSSPMLFSPLTKHHAAGWRSKQRQQIRGTEERRETWGGRGGRTPWPQSTMSYHVFCPPCRYLLHMDVKTVHSCLLPAEMEIRM